MKRQFTILAIAALLIGSAAGQNKKAAAKPEVRVGVTVISDGANVDDIIPALRERVAHEITKKGITGAALQGRPDTVMAEAREKGCEYVLRLKIMQLAAVSIVPGGPHSVSTGRQDVGLVYPGSHVSGEVKIGYRVLPVDGSAAVVDDEMSLITEDPGPVRTDAPADRGPYNYDPISFRRLVSHGTSSAAHVAMKSFKKKTGR